MTIFVTGGAGFIGSNFIIEWLTLKDEMVINIDKLTYAGFSGNLMSVNDNKNYKLVQKDIIDSAAISELFARYQPRAIIHLAAESHVDRSITSAQDFMQTNILGTYNLLQTALGYWQNLKGNLKDEFRFIHISTDEVYGSLEANEAPFSETTAYQPNSPYSASKAASDHLARAWFHTYGLPVITTNCSNNYGPHQFPEKLIPLVITNALKGDKLPIYGDGQQIRDWLFVSDHCSAIRTAMERGRIGETYNVGGNSEQTNLSVVNKICSILDVERPRANGQSYKDQIEFVADRLGHDRRYAVDISKIESEFGWKAEEDFESGMQKTVLWYLNNRKWVEQVTTQKTNPGNA